MLKMSGSLSLVFAFVLQVIVGGFEFLILYGASVALSLAIHSLNRLTSDAAPWLPVVAPYVEMALFGADLFVFSLFVVGEVVKFARALWQEIFVHG